MHTFLEHAYDFFLDHVEEESENLVVSAAEMVPPRHHFDVVYAVKELVGKVLPHPLHPCAS